MNEKFTEYFESHEGMDVNGEGNATGVLNSFYFIAQDGVRNGIENCDT